MMINIGARSDTTSEANSDINIITPSPLIQRVIVLKFWGRSGYASEWWNRKLRKKFFLWASYFIVVLYIIIVAAFLVLSFAIPQIADPAHIAFLKDFIFYFSSPVMLLAILLVLWSREPV